MEHPKDVSAQKRNNAIAYLLAFALAGVFLAYGAPSATYSNPTASENATVFFNWTYINITSGEGLNQSFLEWGNASGFMNVTMDNTTGSATNWFVNMTNLTDATYNYTLWMQNTTGNWSQSARRYVAIDTVAPYAILSCQNLDRENASYILAQNVASSGTCFNILANNVTLDGAGFTVNYSQTTTGYGINNSGGYDNITIKNLNVVQKNGSIGNSAYAIYGGGMRGSNITNNTITTSSGLAIGIVLSASGNSNNVSTNTITTSGLYSLGVYISSSDSNTISSNNITTSGTQGFGIDIDNSGASNILSGNTIATSGSDGYGIYLYSAGISNQIANNNVTSSGNNSYGVYLAQSSKSNITSNILNTTNSYAVYVEPTATISYYNHTIDTTNTEQGEPIYYYFANSSITIENLAYVGQLYVANSTNMTIRNVTLDKDGIIFAMTTNSTIAGSNISASASHGVYLYSSSNSNTLSNNTVSSSAGAGYGIYIYSSSSNNITGGSITSAQSNDYYLTSASTNNNFTSTNFTAARRIYFADTASYFNYNNDSAQNIWLKTNVSAQSYLTRTLVNWNNTMMQWNDTNSTVGMTANYIIAGLLPNNTYYVYTIINATQARAYTLLADSSGSLSAFTVALSGNTEIKVTDGAPNISVASPVAGGYYNTGTIWANITLNENASWCGVSLNGTANQTLTNASVTLWYLSLSVPSEGSNNVTFWCNDTRGNMGNSSAILFTKDTVAPVATSVASGSTTSSTAPISWTTSGDSSNSTVIYGTDQYAPDSTANDSSYVTSHSITLTGLSASRTYYYNVSSCDRAGNCNRSTQYSFATAAASQNTTTTSDTTGGGGGSDSSSTSGLTKVWGYISAGGTATMSITSSKVDVTYILITVSQAASNAKLTVSKVSARPSSTSGDPPGVPYQYISIVAENLADSKISDASISFRMNASWLTTNNINRSTVTLYRYSGGKWNALPTFIAKGSTESLPEYVADTPGFSYFAISAQKNAAPSAPASTQVPAAQPAQQSNATGGNQTGTSEGVYELNMPNVQISQLDRNNTKIGFELPSSVGFTALMIVAGAITVAIGVYYFRIRAMKSAYKFRPGLGIGPIMGGKKSIKDLIAEKKSLLSKSAPQPYTYKPSGNAPKDLAVKPAPAAPAAKPYSFQSKDASALQSILEKVTKKKK